MWITLSNFKKTAQSKRNHPKGEKFVQSCHPALVPEDSLLMQQTEEV
jgi:hypothetical protein